ncbi:LysM peptidoglycan-binding domain-containing protein [Mycolicibacterium iranicum]|nr:LysM peptidoglycan-binding domain-containing protein [Mycolicibacterium iranicum]ORV84597.1 peptidoglycan-binding protein [Mycolicibacterium iranicum]
MTLIDDRETWNEFERAPRLEVGGGRVRAVSPTRRPRSRRPGGAPMSHRGTGVLVSRASHRRRRPITPVTTVALALVAAAITLWLGLVAQSGGVSGVEAEIPSRLAVVQVHSGESLQHVARRVAPDAPVSEVVERIRQLNKLESVSLDAGQTLIAPVA